MQLGYLMAGVAGDMAQQKLDTISNNLANVNTAGYMEDRTSFASQFSNAMGRVGDPEQTSAAFLSMNKQYVSTQAGSVHHTGSDFDFAINGNAYFRVQLADGSVALSRAGNFKMDADGNLLTQGNLAVLDKSDSPITLPVGAMSATKDGTIYVNGNATAELGLSMLRDERLITKGEGVIIKTDKENMIEADKTVSIHHGSLENSNVNAVLSMVSMIDTMRNYQSTMKIVEQYNQQAGLLNDRVGVVQ
ncbi:flagellar hook-basal body protein [Mariprofundus sp. EBB-1]|uniref:flagellar hook-basal body protein n=1 Tax=Mariprofundus sp. EBB-1 TaxID=2650971 RepID=UPI000EF1A691|nr:flagellar hook-basal body protein [Mariprofundus sp. EBB-1]RLL55619.1 flagellar hook-basal body protein [Mariprofundus sp. EBB-1]